jgi:hypothetical protein
MEIDHPCIHHTEINKIHNGEEEGWEFLCHNCGYRARFTVDRTGTQRLEIIFIGDPSARHISHEALEETYVMQEDCLCTPDDAGSSDIFYEDEEAWLTPELRAQVEKIIGNFN